MSLAGLEGGGGGGGGGLAEHCCSMSILSVKRPFLDALASLRPILFSESVSNSFFLDCR